MSISNNSLWDYISCLPIPILPLYLSHMLRATSDQESGLKNVVDVYIWCSVVALCEHMMYPLEGLFFTPLNLEVVWFRLCCKLFWYPKQFQFDLLENSHKNLHPGGVHWSLYCMYMLGASSDQEWELKCGWCGQFCCKLFSIVNDSSLILLRKQPQEVCIFGVDSILHHDGWTPSWSLTESSSTVKFELHSAVDWILGHEVWNSVSWSTLSLTLSQLQR